MEKIKKIICYVLAAYAIFSIGYGYFYRNIVNEREMRYRNQIAQQSQVIKQQEQSYACSRNSQKESE